MKPLPLLIPALTISALTVSSYGVTVLFLGGQAGPTQGADGTIMTLLEERYGAENITYMQSSAANAGDEAAFDVLVLSSTPGSGTMRSKFQDSTTPIFNWEEALAPNRAGEFAVTDGRTKDTGGPHVITILENHPITAGFSVGEDVTIAPGGEVWWSTGTQAPGALQLAHEMDVASNWFLTIVEAGDDLLTGTPAPARRVMFGITDSTFNNFTDEGKLLFAQGIDWAAGASGGVQPLQVLKIDHDRNTDLISLTWNSSDRRTYAVDGSMDMSIWLELDDGIPGEEETTTFTDFTPVSTQAMRYYRVREVQ